jgi:predicted outer membrane repeat protein
MFANPLPALLLALGAQTPPAPVAVQPPRLGGFMRALPDLAGPSGAVFGADGTLYVLESFHARVRVFDAEFAPLREFGGPGGGDGRLCDPRGLALAPDGDLFVADTMNCRISVFSPNGRWRASFGQRGAGPSEFDAPHGVAVDERNVIVADTRNHRIQVFARDGRWERAFGTLGDARIDATFDAHAGEAPPLELNFPVDVALDARGRIFVADQGNSRIVRTDAAGKVELAWGVFGSFPGQLASPSAVRISGDQVSGERVYVCDRDNHRVLVFDLDGKPLYDWGVHALLPHEGAGKLHYPSQIAIAPGGARALVLEDFEQRGQLFGPAGERDIARQKEQELNTAAHFGGAIAARGDLIVACEPTAPGFLVLDTTPGEPVDVTRAAGHGARAGAFLRPEGIELSPDASTAYVADAGAHNISAWLVARRPGAALAYDPALARLSHALDLAALFALERDTAGLVEGRAVPEPVALECAPDGELFALDAANQQVLVLSAALEPRRHFASARRRAGDVRRAGELLSAVDLAFDEHTQHLYVVDQGAGQVRVFSRAGAELFSFGAFGTADGEFLRPAGIACAPDGTLAVSDEGRARILRFDARGHFLGAFGRLGLERAEFNRPRGLAFDRAGQLVVADYGNHRGQTLTLLGEFVNAFGSRVFTEPLRVRVPRK